MHKLKANANEVLFEGEADEYAGIIAYYPICHDDCMEILRHAARLKSVGFSNKKIIERMIYKPLSGLGISDLTKEFE
ncbi:hypothetical protein D3C73_278830 [compost metagenome]